MAKTTSPVHIGSTALSSFSPPGSQLAIYAAESPSLDDQLQGVSIPTGSQTPGVFKTESISSSSGNPVTGWATTLGGDIGLITASYASFGTVQAWAWDPAIGISVSVPLSSSVYSLNAAAVLPNDHYGYVVGQDVNLSNALWSVDLSSGNLGSKITPGGSSGLTAVETCPDGNTVIATSTGGNAYIYTGAAADPSNLTGPTTPKGTLGSDPKGVACSGGYAYTANYSSNSVSVIDLGNDTVANTINLPNSSGPSAVAVGNGYLFVTEQTSNELASIPLSQVLSSNPNITQATVGSSPDAVTVASNVYVGNNGSSNMSILDPTGGSVIHTVSLSSAPNALAVGYAPPPPNLNPLGLLGMGNPFEGCSCNSSSDESISNLEDEASMGDTADISGEADEAVAIDAMGGDPVNTATGNFTYHLPSFGPKGLGPPLSATLTYNSALRAASSSTDVGYGWTSGPGVSLSVNSTSGDVTVDAANGSEITFVPQSSGTCTSGYQMLDNTSSAYCGQDLAQVVLEKNSSTWVLDTFTPRYESYSFCASSTGCTLGSNTYSNNQLESIADGSGNATTLTYPTSGSGGCPTASPSGTAVSSCVIYTLPYPSGSGRSLIFEQNASSQVIAITDSVDTLTLSYCATATCSTSVGSLSLGSIAGDLISASLGATGGDVTDSSVRTWDFGYDETSGLNAINQVLDPNATAASTPYVTTANAYDDASTSDTTFGWVTKQVDAMGLTTSFNYQAYDPTAGTGCPPPGTACTPPGTGAVMMTDPYGNNTLYSYTGFALVGVTKGYGSTTPSTTLYSRDSTYDTGLVTQSIDANGHVGEYSVDSYGRITGFLDPTGAVLSYTYPSSITLSSGAINPAFYLPLTAVNAAGNADVINTYYPDGHLDTVTVNPSYPNAPSSTTDHVTTYSYCESSTCSAYGNSYVQGELESYQDPNLAGTSTQYEIYSYDSSGDLATATKTGTAPGGGSQTIETSYSYDPVGRIYCEVSPKENDQASPPVCPSVTGSYVANTIAYTYDALGEVATYTNADGYEFTYAHDADGNLVTYSDAMSNVTDYFYDKDNRLIQTEAGATSSSPISTYDIYDVTSSQSAYCVSFPVGAKLCTAKEDGNGNFTSTYYDALGRVLLVAPQTSQSSSALISPTSYTYDLAGNVVTKVDGSGTTTYGYNASNQITSVNYSAPAAGITEPSNATFSYYQDGQLKSMTDGTGTTSYTYDNFGRLQSLTTGANNTVTYGYDNNSNVTCISYPNSGSTNCQSSYTPGATTGIVTYTYDTANRMMTMEDWLSSSDVTTFSYDANSNLTYVAYPASTGGSTGSSMSITRTYDPNNKLLTEDLSAPNANSGSGETVDNTYTVNQDGLVATSERSYNGGTPSGGSYSYDALNRVTGAPVESFAYDNASNITVHAAFDSATNLGYNQVDEPCFSSSSAGSCSSIPTASSTITYGYDQAGERCYSYVGTTSGSCANPAPGTSSTLPSQDNITTYGWDQAGNLVCETASNTSSNTCWNQSSTYSSTYSYNALGMRMSETPAGGTTQNFTYDTQGSVPLVLEDANNYYLYGPVGLNGIQTPYEEISTAATPSIYYVMSDRHGVFVATNATGSTPVVFDGFGSYGGCGTMNGGSFCPNSTVPIGFQSSYNDVNTTLDYMYHRYYDPGTDQFLSVDPLVSITNQPYGFSREDPVNLSDPSGEGVGQTIIQKGVGCILAAAGCIFPLQPIQTPTDNVPVVTAQPAPPSAATTTAADSGDVSMPGSEEEVKQVIGTEDTPTLGQCG